MYSFSGSLLSAIVGSIISFLKAYFYGITSSDEWWVIFASLYMVLGWVIGAIVGGIVGSTVFWYRLDMRR